TRPAVVEIHADDAIARGIEHGMRVRMFNELGEVVCVAEVTERIAAGTVALPKGLWRKDTANRATSNALVPDTLTDIAGGACYNDARVEIEAAGATPAPGA